MDLTQSHTYKAPLDAVLVMLRDSTATVAKYESMNHREVEVLEADGELDSLHIRSSRVVEVDLPGFAKRVLKPTNTMVQTDDWSRRNDGSWEDAFDVEVRGAPLHISGTARLVPSGEETRHDVTVHVDVKVPLIGGRIADWATNGDVRRSVEGEFAFNEQWLHDHPAVAQAD